MLVLVPDTRGAIPIWLGVFTLAFQLALLGRSRSVPLRGYLAMVVVGTLWAPVIFAVQWVLMAWLGWQSRDVESSVFIAGPTEEPLKLVPLLALLIFARNRARRFGVVDHTLLGAACGAGFGVAENAVRGTVEQGVLPLGFWEAFTDLSEAAAHNYSLFTLFPGWAGDHVVESSGHAVWTGLVAGGIALMVRYRPVLFAPLPMLVLAWVTLDHMAWNDHVSLGTLLPPELGLIHELTGSGMAARPALLVLVLLGVYLDYRVVVHYHSQLPPIPHVGEPPRTVSLAVVSNIVSDLRFQTRTLFRAPPYHPRSMMFVRRRRELAYGIHRAAGRPRRDDPPRGRMWATGSFLHGITAALLVVLFAATFLLPAILVDAGSQAFLAPRLEALADWWHGLDPLEQTLIIGGAAAGLLLIPGVGAWGALGWASLGAGIAASGRDLANAIRTGTPADLAYAATIVALGRFFPPGARVVLPQGFQTLPGNRYRSPSGLIFGPGAREGHRIDHILDHTRPNPSKPNHTVFNVGGDRTRALQIVDQAWSMRNTHGRYLGQRRGNHNFVIDMGTQIGTRGETNVLISTKNDMRTIVTAYPIRRIP
ncbi:PrsW family glutamic-type intramembrane protease [Lipingzhangella sp. LS1_29]|uniref:PrsW family glutamic-type intramembrane protease n=1 Tax=Lipingzhangella rawalii TaxID=2055835 RepID=A0ABU2H931_9ACTN|nr:PrsW family glutamic-type intramembrane protease [Lipingzhangella rawalii]MDS1271788.1 PrsW family glutamic-type intramembrane protease [Lipingzhangella rawalii]